MLLDVTIKFNNNCTQSPDPNPGEVPSEASEFQHSWRDKVKNGMKAVFSHHLFPDATAHQAVLVLHQDTLQQTLMIRVSVDEDDYGRFVGRVETAVESATHIHRQVCIPVAVQNPAIPLAVNDELAHVIHLPEPVIPDLQASIPTFNIKEPLTCFYLPMDVPGRQLELFLGQVRFATTMKLLNFEGFSTDAYGYRAFQRALMRDNVQHVGTLQLTLPSLRDKRPRSKVSPTTSWLKEFYGRMYGVLMLQLPDHLRLSADKFVLEESLLTMRSLSMDVLGGVQGTVYLRLDRGEISDFLSSDVQFQDSLTKVKNPPAQVRCFSSNRLQTWHRDQIRQQFLQLPVDQIPRFSLMTILEDPPITELDWAAMLIQDGGKQCTTAYNALSSAWTEANTPLPPDCDPPPPGPDHSYFFPGFGDKDLEINNGILDSIGFEAWDPNTPWETCIIAILDTGIDWTHPVLRSHADRIVGVRSFVNYTHPGLVFDDSGHGTAIASLLMASRGMGGERVWGAAPNARYLIGKIADGNGSGVATPQALAEGIFWAVDNGASVISLSQVLGRNEDEEDLALVRAALQHAETHGVVVVCSAGNDGSTSRRRVRFPASEPTVVAVGSVNEMSKVSNCSPYSTPAAPVNVYARGENVFVALPFGSGGVVTGTSFAAPLIAALAAMVKANLGNDATAEKVRHRIQSMTYDATAPVLCIDEDGVALAM